MSEIEKIEPTKHDDSSETNELDPGAFVLVWLGLTAACFIIAKIITPLL